MQMSKGAGGCVHVYIATRKSLGSNGGGEDPRGFRQFALPVVLAIARRRPKPPSRARRRSLQQGEGGERGRRGRRLRTAGSAATASSPTRSSAPRLRTARRPRPCGPRPPRQRFWTVAPSRRPEFHRRALPPSAAAAAAAEEEKRR
ncbi:hypothetical protein DAI22_12g175666 [Oryza sativa Japonica Group]|nr:hypothetical protein DAI22_12g175666 [Oryza sativa Japonica Group]